MKFKSLPLILGSGLITILPGFGAITTYISPPFVVSAEDTDPVFTNVTTADFNLVPTREIDSGGGISVGNATYSGTGVIYPNDSFGGNDLRYLAVEASQSVTITFSQPIRYFGLFFTAGDAYNTFLLKSGDSPVGFFTTKNVLETIPDIPGNLVTTIGGTDYDSSLYYGQPGSGDNDTEPYGLTNVTVGLHCGGHPRCPPHHRAHHS